MIALFIRNFKDTNRMVAELDRDQKDVADDLMQLLIHSHVVAELVAHTLIHGFLEVARLPRVEHLAEDVLAIGRGLALKANRLPQAASDNLAEKLVFDAIVKKD